MISYLINLHERPDRLAESNFMLAQADIVPIVYSVVRPKEGTSGLSQGQRGCYESHMGLLEKISKTPVDNVFAIIEDDIVIGRKFIDNLPRVINLFRESKADLAYLHNSRSNNQETGDVVLVPTDRQTATHFYLVTMVSAGKIANILRERFQRDPLPVDCELIDPRIIKVQTNTNLTYQDTSILSDIVSGESVLNRMTHRLGYSYMVCGIPEPSEVDGEWVYCGRETYTFKNGDINGTSFFRIRGAEMKIASYAADHWDKINLTYTNGKLDSRLSGVDCNNNAVTIQRKS